MIVLIVFLLIWIVYPAYTNGTDGLKEKMDQYSQEKAKDDAMAQKINNLDSLSNALASSDNAAKQDSLLKYLPATVKEEEIIDNLNYLAASDGLAVLNLSVSQPEQTIAPIVGVNPEGEPIGNSAPAASVAVNAATFKANYSVSGPYDKIKDLFDKVYKLERFNQMVSLDIVKPPATGTNKSVGDNLIANATLQFAYLEKNSAAADPMNPVFSQSNFNWGVIQSIASAKSVDVMKLNVDSAGQANPFLPQ